MQEKIPLELIVGYSEDNLHLDGLECVGNPKGGGVVLGNGIWLVRNVKCITKTASMAGSWMSNFVYSETAILSLNLVSNEAENYSFKWIVIVIHSSRITEIVEIVCVFCTCIHTWTFNYSNTAVL